MTTQTLPTDNSADTIAVHGPVATGSRSGRVRAAVATAAVSAVALIAFGATWQGRADDDAHAVVPQHASEADLRLAAESARQMEILAPELYRASPRPASYTDLRLAAEWARRLDNLAGQHS